jgi:hypothetical protein
MATDPTDASTPSNNDPIGDPNIGIQVHMRDLKAYLQSFITNLAQGFIAYTNIANLFTKGQTVKFVTVPVISNAITTDANVSNMFRVETNVNFTIFKPQNIKDGQCITWKVKKTAANLVIQFDATFRYLGSGSPEQSNGANTVDVITGFWDETDEKFYFDVRRGN